MSRYGLALCKKKSAAPKNDSNLSDFSINFFFNMFCNRGWVDLMFGPRHSTRCFNAHSMYIHQAISMHPVNAATGDVVYERKAGEAAGLGQAYSS